jgi:hypothetical protein
VSVADIAPQIARGVGRHFRALGQVTLLEFPLPDGRRADVFALDERGGITIVEIKSSLIDFRTDQKWQDYLDWCDRFYFAVTVGFPLEVLPPEPGLIIADAYGAEVLRPSPGLMMAGARRRSLLLRFAARAATRLARLQDPESFVP